MAVQKLIIRRITLEGRGLLSLVEAMRAHPYDPEEGRGFFVEEEDSDWVRAFFVTKVLSRVNRFVADERKVIQEVVEAPTPVPFSIDMRTGTLDIQSSLRISHKLVDQLGVLSNFSCTIEDLSFDPMHVVRSFRNTGWAPQITRVKLKDFVLRNGIVGDVTFRVTGSGDGLGLMEEWGKAVQAVTVVLTPPTGSEVQLTVTRGGTISVLASNLEYSLVHKIKYALVVGG